ncbi:MAG: hypothetical protein SW833_05270 [Cyanobacteriota bacterium]|nr:hypothetical protein [Cyanobacteriota bacterium]
MLAENLEDLKTTIEMMDLYQRAFYELGLLLSDRATEPKQVEVLAFAVKTLAESMNGDRDVLIDATFSLEREA